MRLQSRVAEKGLTIVPLRLYFTRGIAKVQLGLARGKKLWDKRAAVAKRDVEREIAVARAPPVRGARPERDVERAIEAQRRHPSGERVVIACSGGPDSVALAAALHAVARPMRRNRAAVGVTSITACARRRGRTSAWRCEVAAQLERAVDVVALTDAARDEQRLREARYGALLGAAKLRGCGVVATAHHAEDQSETVLLALLRGSRPDGSARHARPPCRSRGLDLARPLLAVPSDALRDYCHARALPYAVDPTNADAGLRRNAVREALSALRPLFPGLDSAVARAAALVAEERDGSRRAELRRTVRAASSAGEDDLRDIDFVHVEEAVRALEAGRSGNISYEVWGRSENRARALSRVSAGRDGGEAARPGSGAESAPPGEIGGAVERLAAMLAADYRRKPLLLLGVLKGALCFTADLARAVAGRADGPSEIMWITSASNVTER